MITQELTCSPDELFEHLALGHTVVMQAGPLELIIEQLVWLTISTTGGTQ